jgi:PAS domain S-box-containing protein
MRSRPARILLSEAPGPSAEAMKNRLIERGYVVARSYDEATETLDSLRPNLAIVRVGPLKPYDATGNIEEIGGHLNVPTVFLGAPADLALVRLVKGSNFYGYLREPFDDLELDLVLETALDRHRTERNLRESEQWLKAILRSIGNGVVATDAAWRVRFINPAAEELTGWIADEAIGRTLSEVVSVSISAPELIRGGRAQGVLHHRTGKAVPIEERSTTIRNEKGKVIGSVIAIGAMTDHSRDCK